STSMRMLSFEWMGCWLCTLGIGCPCVGRGHRSASDIQPCRLAPEYSQTTWCHRSNVMGHMHAGAVRSAAAGYVQECLSGTGWPSGWVSRKIAGIHDGIGANLSINVLGKTSR